MFGLYRQIHTGPHAIPPCSTYQTKGPDRGIAYIEYVLNEHSSIGCFNLKNYSTVLSQTMRIPIRVVPSTQTRIKETVKPSLAGTLLFVSSAVALRSGISATFRQSNFAHDDQTLSGPRRNTCIPQTNDSIFMIDAPCIWRHINIVLLPHPGLASIHPLHARPQIVGAWGPQSSIVGFSQSLKVLATGVFNSLPQIPSIAVVTYVIVTVSSSRCWGRFFYLLFLTHVHLAIRTIILTADPIDFVGHIRDPRIHFGTEPRMSGPGDDDRWPFDFRILLETALHVQEFSLKTGRQCNFWNKAAL
ncbi:hypothetical protein ABKN59_003031 [Abortiporus biennis]